MYLTFLCAAALAVDGDTLRCLDPQAPDAVHPPGLASSLTGRRAVALAALRADLEAVNWRVRLARIDAPERDEPGFEEASEALEAMLTGPVRCRVVDADPRTTAFERRERFGRIVARCFVDGVDLGEQQVRDGHAVRWP